MYKNWDFQLLLKENKKLEGLAKLSLPSLMITALPRQCCSCPLGMGQGTSAHPSPVSPAPFISFTCPAPVGCLICDCWCTLSLCPISEQINSRARTELGFQANCFLPGCGPKFCVLERNSLWWEGSLGGRAYACALLLAVDPAVNCTGYIVHTWGASPSCLFLSEGYVCCRLWQAGWQRSTRGNFYMCVETLAGGESSVITGVPEFADFQWGEWIFIQKK